MWAFNGLCSIFRREGDRRIQLKTLDIFEGKIDIKFVFGKERKKRNGLMYGLWTLKAKSRPEAYRTSVATVLIMCGGP
jgi:hypothetical protein